ncbi:hypothetical protein JTE90_003848 [Oedothorax gibbosus]|uniref:Spermatogenesis-associated protein 1 C-terminal domain-containing protein n=1 Tax=Oedothorax gibbosus TaxID=931172 RepID=A0AAV6UJQ6_9ARAC|nr:hypothetical protein JTE90_003848 [Oedothorax gibbosus]
MSLLAASERVIPSTTLFELRGDIKEQLGFENVPEVFVFLRSVGRNFTQVKSKQELDLKVKSFVPPCADEPEIYIKEGEYTIVRSASVGAISQVSALNNSDSPLSCSTCSADSQSDSRNDSNSSSSASDSHQRRAFSLNRVTRAAPMSSSLARQRSRPLQKGRPPTPRVQERLFVKPATKFRSSSKASIKLNDSIRESPREQADEETRVVSRTLIVDTDTERINSPPPRPQSQSSKALNSDIRIPVPTPTPTPCDLGKDNNDCDNSFNTKETDNEPERNSCNQTQTESGTEYQPAPKPRTSSSFYKPPESQLSIKDQPAPMPRTSSSFYKPPESQLSVKDQPAPTPRTSSSFYKPPESQLSIKEQPAPTPRTSSSFYKHPESQTSIKAEKENIPDHQELLQEEVRDYADVCECERREDAGNDQRQTKSNKDECNDSLKKCRFMLDNMHSKMEDEDIIVDPIKMLKDEGESLKNSDDNGRDHFDEGFHSGELVASEEDSNTVEALEHPTTGVKDEEEFLKPIRVSTPMPRSSSFYKSPEMHQLQTSREEVRAERRLRELKRDALMQKVRDLQRRKASSKDRACEEWRKRYQDVKKSTPRLEDHCGKLRQELEKLVKDMLVSVKVDPDSKPHKPSKKTSYKIMIMRHLQEVEDLKRRLQSVTIRLNAETKLRAQAEFEVKRLRQDLLHKKTQVTLTRKQTAFPHTSEQFFISAV